MNRRPFIQSMFTAMATLPFTRFQRLTEHLQQDDHLMPVLFIGHGSPMNGIEINDFSTSWAALGKTIPQPKAVLCVSAHWLTKGTAVTAMETPRTIHDFGGFPKALFDVQYPVPGDPELARETIQTIRKTSVAEDHDWGLDHGTWTVVRHMYPDADIPVLQLSIDYHQPPEWHYQLGQELAALRRKGVLIIGSGNMVHNLGMVAWDKLNEPAFGFDWALEMDTIFKDRISSADHQALIHYRDLNKAATLAIPTPDHYYPLLYTLGATMSAEKPRFFNDRAVGGSLTMTSVQFG
ncbi:MAG: 4,5-DOPA dioxygenase extradiol [Saprospiraceae bacterium]